MRYPLLASLSLLLLVCPRSNAEDAAVATHLAEWLNPVDGEWTDGSNWSLGGPYPNNGQPLAEDRYNVVLGTPGDYTVSLRDSVAVESIQLATPGAKLSLGESRLETSFIDATQGTLQLGFINVGRVDRRAEIVGATIQGNVEFDADSSSALPVLIDVSLETSVHLPTSGTSPRFPALGVENTLELAGANTITLERSAVAQFFGDTTIAGSGTFLFGDGVTSGGDAWLELGPNTNLTISPDITMRTVNSGASIQYQSRSFSETQPIALVNHGTLSAEGTGNRFEVLNLRSDEFDATFKNYGTVQAINGGVLVVGGEWTNSGRIVLGQESGLVLAGRFSRDDLGTIERSGGTLYINGWLENAGETFIADGTTGDIEIGYPGPGVTEPTRLRGGRIESAEGARWLVNHGSIEDVTLATDLIVGEDAQLYIAGDLVMDGGTIQFANRFGSRERAEVRFAYDPLPRQITGTGDIRFEGGLPSFFRIGEEATFGPGIRIQAVEDEPSFTEGILRVEGLTEVLPDARLTFDNEELTLAGETVVEGQLTISRRLSNRDDRTKWKNTGTIRLRPGSELIVNGNSTLADLGHFTDEGAAYLALTGDIDLEGGTFDAGELGFGSTVLLNTSQIKDGTVRLVSPQTGQATAELRGANLDNVRLVDDFHLTDGPATLGRLRATNTLTLDHMDFTLNEATELSFSGPIQRLEGTATFDAQELVNTTGTARIRGDQLVVGRGIHVSNAGGTELEVALEANYGTMVAASPTRRFEIGPGANASDERWSNYGTLRASGGTMEVSGELENYGTITADFGSNLRLLTDSFMNSGVLLVTRTSRVSTGITVERGSIENSPEGLLTGTGNLTLNAQTTFTNNGAIHPGDGVGDLILSGTTEFGSTAVLAIEMTANRADTLYVNGNVSLDGDLKITLLEPQAMTLGSSFTIVQTSGGGRVSGAFANALGEFRQGHALYEIEYQPNAVVATVVRVPEPSSVAFAGLLSVAAMFLCRRSARKH